jgi:itaconyl-CoA hydratase
VSEQIRGQHGNYTHKPFPLQTACCVPPHTGGLPLYKTYTRNSGMTGKFFEDLEAGMFIKHTLGRTLTEMDNVLFSSLTMNTQPLHINQHFASTTPFGRCIINGIFTLGLVVGITVTELTAGTIVANLGYENVSHPHPMFAGDTLYVETEIISKRESRSRPEAGIVTMKHIGRNQDGTVCIEVTRSALFLRREITT